MQVVITQTIIMARYRNIPTTTNSDGTQYYTNVRYPEVPLSFNDIYVRTTEGDRFDTIAQQYYGDSSYGGLFHPQTVI